MIFDECDEAGYRIYGGAIEGPCGDGFVAAVVLERLEQGAASKEVFRDVALSGGHRWRAATEALAFAMRKGREMALSKSAARGSRSPSMPCVEA